MRTITGVSISLAAGVVLLVAVASRTPRYADSPGEQANEPIAPSAATQRQRPAPAETDPEHIQALVDSVPVQRDAGPATGSPANWMDRLRASADYWELASDAAALAVSGDHRAQYVLARTLGHCNAEVGLYRRLYPDPALTAEQIIAAALAQPINRAVPVPLLERGRREFMRCAAFFAGHPPVLVQLGTDATTQEYWLRRALEGNDPLAHLDQVSADISRLPSLDEQSQPGVLDSIRERLSLAAASADPETWFRIGRLLARTGSSVRSEWPAWILAACEAGYDCTYSNPDVGNGCIEAGNCAAGDTLVLQMQRELRGYFGESYARSQEIRYAFQHGDGERVINEMLDRIVYVTPIAEPDAQR